MKVSKSLALGMTTALAVGGTVVAGAGAAQASSGSFHLYSQIKKTTLQSSSYNTGNVNVAMTVTPSSAVPGTPLTIAVTSPDMFMKNGPASNAAIGAEEADAVVNFNGQDYVLRGSQNGQQVTYDDSELDGTVTPNHLFDPGWVISSEPGASSSTSTNTYDGTGTLLGSPSTVAGSTGIGATIRGAEATPVAITAPAAGGTYNLTLKAVVVNAVAGTSTVALTDDFDNVYNTVNCTASCATNGNWAALNNNSAASYIDPYSPVVSFESLAPAFAIDKVTTNNDTVDLPNSNTASNGTAGPKVRAGDFVTFSGNNHWTASSHIYGTVCTNDTASSCAPAGAEAAFFAGTAGGYTMTNGFSVSTDADGNLPSITAKIADWTSYTGTMQLFVYQTTTRPAPPGYSGTNSNGPLSAGVTAKANQPIYALTAARTLSASPASVEAGAAVTVTGSNYYPGETVSLDSNGSEAAVTTVADSSGAISKSYTLKDTATTKVTATALAPTGTTTVDSNTVTVTDTTAPTGSATVSPTSGAMGLTATLTLRNVNDNAGAAGVTKTVAWGDGSTSSLGSGVNTAKHKFSKLGTYTVKVTLKDAKGNPKVLTAGTVKTRDVVKPVMKVTALKSSAKKVKSVSGTITDNVAPRYAKIKLVEKRGSKWYYYTGSKWKKTTSKKKALSKAKWLTDTSVSSKHWSISVKKMAKGSLVVAYYGIDKAGNKSAVKYYSKKLKK